ncbi:H-hydrate dehydratase [Halteromyces radiatus]|uniref:H-hydrate dehydratase n=1 Tax=Halteromyces radiatus TaxID=101107 RepID=UPI00221E8369|nr:H-hydrate dehydratase [Halteromyces radiatus]KAI8079808.1 H-hydrate dehydratase [Halteromyces radiatus]
MVLPKPDLSQVKKLIPPLSGHFHKGQAGRIGIIGGSEEYTGAPYFSGISSMKLGADLCNIFCEPSAAIPIKSYSPDLIVHPSMRTSKNNDSASSMVNEITNVFSRLHVLVVGPGLSRDDTMQDMAKQLVQHARKQNMALVVDADGLYLVQKHPDIVKGYQKAVLTPNVVEFSRLCKAMGIDTGGKEDGHLAQQLSQALGGVTIVQKGENDIIANDKKVFVCDAEGGLKRMGGQGDILSGTIATFLAWGKGYEEGVWKHDNSIPSADIPLYAAWSACTIVRESSRLAFKKYGRAVLTSHMLEEIGHSYDTFIHQ